MTRLVLVLGLVAFGTVVSLGVRERVEPAAAPGVDRDDPKALAEIRGAQVTQAAGELKDYTYNAGLQQLYEDGSLRLSNGFRVDVPEQADRDGFLVTGGEARVDADQDRFVFTRAESAGDDAVGDPTAPVLIRVSDGLGAETDTAIYSRQDGTVSMPGATTLRRMGMTAVGHPVAVDTNRSLATLDGEAHVSLAGDDGRATLDIWSNLAVLAHDDGYMNFDGGTRVSTGTQFLEADHTTAHFGADETALERLELHEHARIYIPTPAPGALREMLARDMTLAFEDTTRVLEQAILSGDTVIELAGVETATGAQIRAGTMKVTMSTDGTDVAALEAHDGVVLALPDSADGASQEIRATGLVSQGTPETGLNNVQFTEAVEYREQRAATATGRAVSRVIRADRLEAGVKPGLSGLLTAQFLGNVRFEEDDRTATADEVFYDVIGGIVTLNTVGEAGRGPTVTDDGIRIEASTLTLSVDGWAIEATDDVRSELTPETAPTDGATGVTESTLPALLDSAQQTFATAGGLTYDPDVGQAAYTGGARLWQGETSFAGDTVSLDDQTGGLSASGTVTTTIQLVRFHESTGESAVSLTRVAADEFLYDEAARQATYDGKAVLLSDAGDMKADRIDVFLQADGRTLDRFEATGNVKLLLEGRWATGDLLVYDELTGRYDMEGAPVQIVEEVEPEEPAVAAPPPRRGAPPPVPSCSTMEGRKLTFYRSDDTVTVDGQQVLRTESKSGNCAPLAF
ncbi:MAG: LptA/OstA family protein [Acidobacteriota bacterium]|nr:LptA/OstA family protein [Acidobacteriota bacterium]